MLLGEINEHGYTEKLFLSLYHEKIAD